MPKVFIFIIFIVVLFILLSNNGNEGGRDKNAQSIYNVLLQDENISKNAPSIINNENVDEWLSKSKYFSRELNKINLYSCPDNFVTAYKNHCNAWVNMYMISSDINKAIESGLNPSDAKERIKNANITINDTWLKVISIAKEYGITFSEE